MKKSLLPPIGLKPKKIHIQQRVLEILYAMIRYAENDKKIPKEWFDELIDLFVETSL